MNLTIRTAVPGGFDRVVEATIGTPADERFGVPLDIDAQVTLEENPPVLVGTGDNRVLDSIAGGVHDRFERVLSTLVDELESLSEA